MTISSSMDISFMLWDFGWPVSRGESTRGIGISVVFFEDWGFFIRSCRGCWIGCVVQGPTTVSDPLHGLGLVIRMFRDYLGETWKRFVMISTDVGLVIRMTWTLPPR